MSCQPKVRILRRRELCEIFPTPSSLSEVRGYLGLASYYRRFVKDFASIACPLHDLTKGGHDNSTGHLKQTRPVRPLVALRATTNIITRSYWYMSKVSHANVYITQYKMWFDTSHTYWYRLESRKEKKLLKN